MPDHWLIPPRTRSRAAPRRGVPPHPATLFEGFAAYLTVERQCRPGTLATYRWCFADFLRFAEGNPRTPVAVSRFTADLVRAYQYRLAERGLGGTTIRLRLAVLASFARWAVRSGRLLADPVELLVRPPRRTTLPTTLRWDAVQELLERCRTRRDRAIVALLAYGGLRRSEIVTLDIVDFDPGFGLGRVHGKGGHDAAVPLPASARAIVSDYLGADRPDAAPSEPLFLVSYPTVASKMIVKRMHGRRVWKLVRDLGERSGIERLHPHALRHACAVELLRQRRISEPCSNTCATGTSRARRCTRGCCPPNSSPRSAPSTRSVFSSLAPRRVEFLAHSTRRVLVRFRAFGRVHVREPSELSRTY